MSSKKEYQRAYYLLHQEKLKKRSKRWRLNNLARDKKVKKDYYLENREKLLSNSLARQAGVGREEHKRSARKCHLKKTYHFTVDGFNALLASQGGGCAICGSTVPHGKGWHIDHNHACCPGRKSCGKCIRGILCQKCNAALGMFKDKVDILKKAIEYLEINILRRRLAEEAEFNTPDTPPST